MYIRQRKGYNIRAWRVAYEQNRFKFYLFIEGTEPEMHAYLKSEMGFVGAYTAMDDSEVTAIRKLRIPIYLAPELSDISQY